MTKEEWFQIITRIRQYYEKGDFLKDDESKELWYEQLKKVPYELMKRTIDRYATENRFPPTLADIMETGYTVWNEDKKKEAYVCMTKRSDQ